MPANANDESQIMGASLLPTVGEQFDKYTLLAKLATGGMAELFVARLSGAAGFSKTVVIKRILPHVAHDENFTRMFLDEALTCAQITHPNVCQVFELCEANDSHFLVLEHLEGATVGDLIRRCIAADQQLNLRLAAGIIVQACDGLHAAHEQTDSEGHNIGLVHRDVSPANLFVTVDGIVKVLDFGIAKAGWMSRKTRTGTLLGKCEYMSPEQARGGVPVDRRSDIFSLGITAWELLCGRRLFRREGEYETLKAVLRAPIESPRSLRPTVPEALDQAIMCALERDPADRFHTAYEFRKAIADSLRDVGGPTPMCDLAPVIRKSFAEELKIQRAILKKADEITSSPPSVSTPRSPARDIEELNRLANKKATAASRPDSDVPAFVTDISATEPHLQSEAEEEDEEEDPTLCQRKPSSADVPTPRISTEAVQRSRVGLTVAVIVASAGLAAVVMYVAMSLLNKKSTPEPATTSSESQIAPAPEKTPATPSEQAPVVAPKTEALPTPVVALSPSAIVTALDSGDKDMGALAITSTAPAKIYLYPKKILLGTTPILDYRLSKGVHKFKAELEDGQKKYFQVRIVPGKTRNRQLSHWH